MKRSLKIAAGLVVAAGLAGAAAWFLRRPAAPVSAVVYATAPVGRADITRSVATMGQLTPLVSVEVSTQVSGLITEVAVDFNTVVKKGQLLARIDPSSFEQKLKQAQADLAAADATHKLAQMTADRRKALLERGLLPQSDYDEAVAQLQQAEATQLTRRAGVENAQVDLDRCTISSPIDGVVIFRSADVGRTVAASLSAPTLFVIAQDLRQMQIIAPITEADISAVRPQQPVTFTVGALPGRQFHGVVRQIRNPYTPADKQNSTPAPASGLTSFDAVIEVDNADQVLLPSLTASVAVIIERHADVLCLPNTALRLLWPKEAVRPPTPPAAPGAPVSDVAVVYRLRGGDPQATPEAVWVQLGITDDRMTEIVSGLAAGDLVVTGISLAPVALGGRIIF